LRGEKIDIIEYDQDALVFAANALSPAKINHVSVLEMEQKHLEVIVEDTQLSLAIGKKGQNVRLAAKLLGWHIDIKSEEEKRQEIELQMAQMALRGAPISELKGLGDKTLDKLRDHGMQSVEQLAQMTPDDLMQLQGIGEKTVERIRRVVTDYFEQGGRRAALELAAEGETPEPTADAPAEAEAASETQSELPTAVEAVPESTASVAEQATQASETVPATEATDEQGPADETKTTTPDSGGKEA
jgi:N utilization substance protein A